MMFYEKFEELCAARGVTPSKVANDIGISRSNAKFWREGVKPSPANLLKLASYFGVPVTYFASGASAEQTVTGNNNIAINGDNNTIGAQNEMEKALLSLFRSLSPIEQAYEITRLDGIVNKK